MKSLLLVLFTLLFLSVPQKQILAQPDLIAAVYYDEKPPIEHLKKRTKKEVKKNIPPKNKALTDKYTRRLKIAGIILLIAGGLILPPCVILILSGLGFFSSSSLIVIFFGLVSIAALILGTIFLVKALRKESKEKEKEEPRRRTLKESIR